MICLCPRANGSKIIGRQLPTLLSDDMFSVRLNTLWHVITCYANNGGSCCVRRQWRANGCNNFQQCWDLQCIVGRIQPIISLCKPCVMSVRGPNNVGRAVQTFRKLKSVKVTIGFPVVRTDGLSVGRCTVTWLLNFPGWVDLLSYGTPPTRARSVRLELHYQFDERSTNSTFLYCKKRLFHTKVETCDKLKLFPWDPGRELFLQLPCGLTTSSNNVLR